MIYFEGIPHPHAEDKYSAFSACFKLRQRSMSTQIETLQGCGSTNMEHLSAYKQIKNMKTVYFTTNAKQWEPLCLSLQQRPIIKMV
jgi:hypothetical protein